MAEEKRRLLERLSNAMRRSKRLEITVYAVLAGAVLLLVLSSFWGEMPKSGDNTEKRLESALRAIDGAGRVEVMITYNENSEEERENICGVIVIAEGAGNMDVRVNLMRAVQTVLGVGRESVEIFQMGASG